MVSEYSSSARNGSSEESKKKDISTSGSGSGGNTGSGSGTGSGSNQGGSSGSGNDQEGTSSNGNGSGASGNEIGKGSSEEKDSNDSENNDKINTNGSGTPNNNEVLKKETSSIGSQCDTQNLEILSPAIMKHLQQSHVNNKSYENSAREKKLQDKKRKRMNMRREYEDKMEQEMESSESSYARCDLILIRPGKPITLDKAVAFTKVAKLVCKASPPFTVIYTNAAYSRLCGIDSHNAVGKHLSNLLSLPVKQSSQQELQNQCTAAQNSVSNEPFIRRDKSSQRNLHSEVSKNHIAAAAAGRARAAASKNDNIEIGIGTLFVAGSYHKQNKVNVRCNLSGVAENSTKSFKSKVEEEGSNEGSSLTSNTGSAYNMLECIVSISPVMSSPDAYAAAVIPDQEKQGDIHNRRNISENECRDCSQQQKKAKKRKHHHHSQPVNQIYQSHGKQQVISHYLIQMESFDSYLKANAATKDGLVSLKSGESLNKSENYDNKVASGNHNHRENDIESFGSSSNYKSIAAIGS